MSRMSCIQPMLRVIGILKKGGLHPTGNITRAQFVKRTFHFCYYLLIVISVLMNMMKAAKTGNEMALNRMFCILVPIINFIAKVFTTLLNENCVLSILDDLKSSAFNGHSEELNDYIKLVYRISEVLWKYYSLTEAAFLLFTAVLPIIVDIDIMMIPAPFDMGKYDMVYKIIHLITTLYLAISALCYDSFLMILMAICIAQVYILSDRLMNVFKDAALSRRSRDVKTVGIEEIRIIKECITLHEAVNQFVNKLSAILSFPIFMQYICGCFMICNAILRLTILGETGTATIISIVTWAGIVFFQLAVYHWLGNEITFKKCKAIAYPPSMDARFGAIHLVSMALWKSAQLVEACYMSEWYMLNRKSQKLLMILMERASKPLVIKLYKLAFISLESLGTIIRWSYSLFALIKARYS